MYLIDTMVLSELRRRQRDPGVVAWIARQQHDDLFLSVVSIGEIERGIARQRSTDPAFAEELASWLKRLLHLHRERMLAVDLPVARRWGQLSAALGHDSADLLIAATALEHGLTVVTRNLRHFTPTGVATLDPWQGEG
ncbi:MAG: type II toxin-antitoxin system VapC family toxin [Cyanobacteria bacterium]|nr:type II toxin-antitoxin system VapC family toxin [Cyanobacteriota bacterium]